MPKRESNDFITKAFLYLWKRGLRKNAALALVALGGYLAMLAYYLPYFETPIHRGWVLKDYPITITGGGGLIYAAPIINAFLALSFKLLKRFASVSAVINRGVYGVILLIGLLGFVLSWNIYGQFMASLFGGLVNARRDSGWYVVMLAHLASIAGGFIAALVPKAFALPEKSSTKLAVEAVDSPVNSQLRRRKLDKGDLPARPAPIMAVDRADHVHQITVASIIILSLFTLSSVLPLSYVPPKADMKDIELPEGFEVELYADNVPEARSMTWSPTGILFVSTREKGDVYALLDPNLDHRADKVVVIASGKWMPNGIVFRNGSLYVAEVDKLWRYDRIEDLIWAAHKNGDTSKLKNTLDPVLLYDKFPQSSHHGWKYLNFGPDGRLYVPVGAPCNLCKEKNPFFASILRQKVTTNGTWDFEVFASGVRNSVGFDWHPETNELWFTNNGRDFLDDSLPPDELKHAPVSGLNFGFPYCYGKNQRDPEVYGAADCDQSTGSVLDLGVHTAALAVKFYRGNMFPAEYKNQLFIAEHGSWNKKPIEGYRVMSVKLNGTEAVSYENFLTGLTKHGEGRGRPVDLLELPDGSLLVSDDHANRIYRITYSK